MPKQIGTHNGAFHADEALACALLTAIPEYADATITRTRDPALLATMDIVVDVGSEYDPARHRYDHHQPEFKDTFSPAYNTRLSSAGLVYKHFGRLVISTIAGSEGAQLSEENREVLYEKVYEKFVEAFDGVDNGIPMYPPEIKPAYYRGWDIFSQVSSLNPAWNEDESTVDRDANFMHAVKLTGDAFKTVLCSYLKSWLPARTIITDSIATNPNSGGAISGSNPLDRVVVLQRNCPWKEHLFAIEKEMDREGYYLYVVYPDLAGGWRIQAVPTRFDSFELRKSLPLGWLGLRDTELDNAIGHGSTGAVFVHRNGFIGGHQSLQGVLLMAELALK